MLRRFLIVVASLAGLALAACGTSGPSDPMPGEDMPMQVTAADSLSR